MGWNSQGELIDKIPELIEFYYKGNFPYLVLNGGIGIFFTGDKILKKCRHSELDQFFRKQFPASGLNGFMFAFLSLLQMTDGNIPQIRLL